ncbi:MAG: hypothetical protein ABIO92_04515 [Chloroflexia bacterium]
MYGREYDQAINPFESLVGAITNLSLKDKAILSQLLEEQLGLAEAEEEIWEQDPTVRSEIE